MHNERHFLGNRMLSLLGIGAVAAGATGLYLYRHPRLRKKMRNADSVREAATLLTKQVSHDSAEVADNVMHAMSDGVSTGLKRTRNVLGLRFLRAKREVKREAKRQTRPAKIAARHAKNEVKHLARTASADARNMSDHARIEGQHLMDEMKEARDLSLNRAANA